MEHEKQKVVQEREKIENEIRSIKAMNEELYRQNNMVHTHNDDNLNSRF